MRMTHRLRRMALLGFLVAAAVAAGCGGETSEPTSKPGGTSAKVPKGESETVAVSMKDNFFEPKEITVERGEAITFNVKNDGQAIHDMHIMSMSAEGKDFISNATIQPAERNSFTATFAKAGTLKFQCDYHLPDMVGTITVK